MRTSRLPALTTAALTALLLVGCTGQNAQPNGAETPEPVDDAAILVALEQIDPGLNTQGSITDADEICSDIQGGGDPDDIDAKAQELFGDQAESPLSTDQARQIVQILATEYCS